MPTIDATVGGANANSYETYAEANAYFVDRIPLTPPWVTSGNEAYLITATRLIDNCFSPIKTLIRGNDGLAYYRISRAWTGQPATATQRRAWPRIGMFDGNGNALDVAIVGCSVANPSIVETSAAHRRQTGDTVLIFDMTGSTPDVNGEHVVTVIDSTHFSIPVDVTVAGTGGRFSIIPQELKDAESEFAGQLLKGDRSLDNDVIVQGLTSVRAGSVSLTFKDTILPQVMPDAVLNMMPDSWFTDELYSPADQAVFEVASRPSLWPGDVW